MTKTIDVKAYAKINLFLDITGILPNGYHSLNNVMQKIELHDKVTVSADNAEETEINLSCDNPEIPCDKRNIAFKAAEAYLNAAGIKAKINIDIKKSIPVMAGLGGSSTDGAAVLKALDSLFGELDTHRLSELAAGLGADVPFCLLGKAAICKGIGEIITETAGLFGCTILIVKPNFSCSTAEGYSLYDKKPIMSRGEPAKLLKALEKIDLETVGNNLYNIFEPLYNDGRIENIKREHMQNGALGSLLSGSGSAVYGIYPSSDKALAASKKMNYPIKIVTNPVFPLEK